MTPPDIHGAHAPGWIDEAVPQPLTPRQHDVLARSLAGSRPARSPGCHHLWVRDLRAALEAASADPAAPVASTDAS